VSTTCELEPVANLEEMNRTLALFHSATVTEIRVFKLPSGKGFTKTLSGYFDQHRLPDRVGDRLKDCKAEAVWFSVNPVQADLVARGNNRFVVAKRGEATNSSEITCRHWIFIDLDAEKPAGVSATEEEHEATHEVADQVFQYLVSEGCGEPILADSGNGYHLHLPVDLPNDEDSKQLVHGFLEALKSLFETEQVNVDLKVADANRMTKLYGSVARKGDSTAARPHRVSRFVYVPNYLNSGWCEPTPREVIEKIASKKKEPEQPTAKTDFNASLASTFSVEQFLTNSGIAYQTKSHGGGTMFTFACPFGFG